MTITVLNQVPPRWRRYFNDVLVAVRPIVAQPLQLRSTLERWADTEPVLAPVRTTQLFAHPGSLTDPQLRALIRISRSHDPAAETATWAVICQLLPAVVAAARSEAFSIIGSDGPQAAVNTAIGDLWRHIHHIDLETNKASIFFALSHKVRHTARSTGPGHRSTYQLICSLVDPNRFTADPNDEYNPSVLPTSNRPRTSWLDPDPTGGTHAFETAEWRIDADALIDHLTEFLANDMASALSWNPNSAAYPCQRQRLAAYLRTRIEAAAAGSPTTAIEIAAEMGASYHTIRDLQKRVTRLLHHNADRYRTHALTTFGTQPNTEFPTTEAA